MRRLCFLILAASAMAFPMLGGPIFDSGGGNGITFRAADNGPGQGISVATTTALTDMAISLAMPGGGNIKYMIWDSTNTNLLFSETQAVSASASTSFVLATPFSFTLNAGQTYYFGVIADNNLNVDYIFPPVASTQNGLTALTNGNSNYTNFANPASEGLASAEITLQLFGTGSVATPEPGTFLPLAFISGMLLLFGVRRLPSKRAVR